MSISSIFKSELFFRAVMLVASRSTDRILGRIRCWSYGIKGKGFLGSNCKILGSKYINFGLSPFILENAWLEAVAEYRGAVFTPRITLGDRVCASPGLHITGIGKIDIGDDCLFGSNVFITDHSHGEYGRKRVVDTAPPPAARPLNHISPVGIGSGCWIGNNVCILGANIGDNCVIGANAVVTKDIPSNSIAVGAPASVIAKYDPVEKNWY